MMRKIFLFIALTGLIAGACKSGNKPKEDTTTVEQTTKSNDAQVNDQHDARNSLDYQGTYKGIMPCADCEGIETTLEIKESDYVLSMKYIGKGSDPRETSGKYSWKTGSIIVLEGISDSPNQYFVGENWVKQLDMEGNVITGSLAEHYILKKE